MPSNFNNKQSKYGGFGGGSGKSNVTSSSSSSSSSSTSSSVTKLNGQHKLLPSKIDSHNILNQIKVKDDSIVDRFTRMSDYKSFHKAIRATYCTNIGDQLHGSFERIRELLQDKHRLYMVKAAEQRNDLLEQIRQFRSALQLVTDDLEQLIVEQQKQRNKSTGTGAGLAMLEPATTKPDPSQISGTALGTSEVSIEQSKSITVPIPSSITAAAILETLTTPPEPKH